MRIATDSLAVQASRVLWPDLRAQQASFADAVYTRLVTAHGRLQSVVKDALLIVTFALVIAGSAQITIRLPFTPVPITGQTFAVLLAGAALGSRRGALAATAYLAMGLAGGPFFAGHQAGLFIKFTSGGYLMSYPVAAFVVGWLTERGWNRGLWLVTSLLIGNVIIYVFGLAWLGGFIASNAFRAANLAPWYALIPGDTVLQKTLIGGLYPFIPGDLVKVGLACLAVPSAWGFVGLLDKSPNWLSRTVRGLSRALLPASLAALWIWAALWTIHIKS